ncbi:MAG TPA: TetR/AcrR family transcriptional regulator [Acidimicrobiales bacterium]|jgi:AcrR family transcriptional regulator
MPKAASTNSRAGSPAEGRELRARGQRTVRRLLDAGIQVFGARGYHTARVDDIVKVAKTSHGTFYLYFANKEDLFRALVVDVADEMSALVESLGALTADADGYDMLRDWIEQFSQLHARYGPVIKAWTEAEIDTSEFGRMGTDLLGGFVAALGLRIAQSPAVVPDPQLAALAIVAMVERCNYYAMTRQVRHGDDLTDTLAEIAFASLFGTAVRRKMTSVSGSRRARR